MSFARSTCHLLANASVFCLAALSSPAIATTWTRPEHFPSDSLETVEAIGTATHVIVGTGVDRRDTTVTLTSGGTTFPSATTIVTVSVAAVLEGSAIPSTITVQVPFPEFLPPDSLLVTPSVIYMYQTETGLLLVQSPMRSGIGWYPISGDTTRLARSRAIIARQSLAALFESSDVVAVGSVVGREPCPQVSDGRTCARLEIASVLSGTMSPGSAILVHHPICGGYFDGTRLMFLRQTVSGVYLPVEQSAGLAAVKNGYIRHPRPIARRRHFGD